MIHEIIPVGVLQCNCSVFGDEQTRKAIVIDPGDDVSKINEILDRHGLKLTAIIITHGHIDHVLGANALREQTGAPVYLNERDRELIDRIATQAAWLGIQPPEIPKIDALAKDGLALQLGNSEFQILETPGHTQGSVSVYIPQEQKLIAGDTLFRDSVGRTDLPGGNTRQLMSSIKTRLLELPEQTVVTPGHGAQTTIGREKERNPFLRNLF